MALPHAHLLDVIDIHPLGPALHDAVSTSLIKTDRMQLLHLVIPARKDQQQRHVDDECTIHCLEGDVEVVMPGGTRRLGRARSSSCRRSGAFAQRAQRLRGLDDAAAAPRRRRRSRRRALTACDRDRPPIRPAA